MRGAPITPGLGDRIRKALKKLGYWDERLDAPKIRDFCKKTDFFPNEIWNWMGDRGITLPNAQRLARALDVPLAYLLLGEEAIQEVNEYQFKQKPKASGWRKRHFSAVADLGLGEDHEKDQR